MKELQCSPKVPAAVIENVAKNRMPVGPLAVSDELIYSLIMGEDQNLTAHEIQLKNTLAGIIETHQRTGKREGWGFYDYPKNEKKSIWKEWATIYPQQDSYDEEKWKRLGCCMVIDSYKCLDSVIREPKDADVGSILGLGFPVYTGG
jgi:3-hydroxyacyl-CoA dehydrogenase/enoyl-CoA hydratase/3-hydroxybutyryl-CoA epimerase